MGCRAFLSEYQNEQGESIFTGRGNCGAVTLNLPRFALKANGDMNVFYNLITENFYKAIRVHQFTYNRMRKVKAKTNPLFFELQDATGRIQVYIRRDDICPEGDPTLYNTVSPI